MQFNQSAAAIGQSQHLIVSRDFFATPEKGLKWGFVALAPQYAPVPNNTEEPQHDEALLCPPLALSGHRRETLACPLSG